MNDPAPHAHDIESILLKARVKARLFGRADPVRVGRFELIRRCGQGGEGVVYEAFDPSLGRRVALKCLHAEHALRGGSLQHEFRAMARLVHPNLALLYELFCVDGCWFHSMELLSGVSFLEHVRADGQLSEERLRSALRQLLHGLVVLHAAGKVHRDLKPNNVLIEPDGRAVIVDYGLIADPSSALGAAAPPARAGTLAYMAPEQASNGRVHASADMYAVGVMLFEALHGVRPDASPRPSSLATSPRAAPDPARDLERLCAALLAEEPSCRPSAHEALAWLGADAASTVAPTFAARSEEHLVGRAAELRVLHDAYACASAGRAALALVHGESGMGKSALLTQLRRELCAGTPAPLLWEGVCYERENTPYKMFDGVIAALVERLASLPLPQQLACLPPDVEAAAQIFPALRRLPALANTKSPASGERSDPGERAFAAVRALFLRLRAQAPVVICVDDLQWGDVDSLRLLQQLLAPPAPAVLLVVAYRRSEVATSPLLQQVLEQGGLYRLDCEVFEVRVDALDPCAARALITMQSARGTPRASTDVLERQLQAASGVPFLLRALSELDPRAGTDERELTVEGMVLGRVARCSPAARQLLQVLSLAGRPLQMSLALRVADVGSDGWLAASELCANRLARWRDTDGERCLEPYHDLIRSQSAASATREQARLVHASIVRHMQALDLDEPTHLVDHLIAAGEPGQAGQVAVTAATLAGKKLAWDSAARLLGLALELLPAAYAENWRLRAQYGEALAFAGRHRAAAASYRRAAALAPRHLAAPHLRNAAQQLMRAGDVEPAISLLEELLCEVGLRYPRSEARAFAIFAAGRLRRGLLALPKSSPERRPALEEQRLATLATVYAELWLVDPVRSLAIHAWFFETACRARDRYRLQALTWESASLAVVQGPGGQTRVQHLLDEIDLQAGQGADYDRAVAKLARAVYLIHVERRPRDALPLLTQAERTLTSECRFERCFLALMLDHVHEAQGDFASLAEAVLKFEHAQCEDAYSLHRLLVSVPLVKLAYDQPEGASSFLRAHRPSKSVRATISDFTVCMHLSSVQLYQGEAQAAFETLRSAWSWLRISGMFYSSVMRELADFYRARVAAALYRESGDPRWREQARAREWRPFDNVSERRALTCMIEASLARADEQHTASRALLLEAARELERAQNDTAYWAVRYRLAELEAGPAALEEARAWMCSHGIRNPERWVTLFVP